VTPDENKNIDKIYKIKDNNDIVKKKKNNINKCDFNMVLN